MLTQNFATAQNSRLDTWGRNNKCNNGINDNKDVAFNDGEYKQYNMTANQFGQVFSKPYHVLEFEAGEEEWGIYFPCYELPTFKKLTGLDAE